MALPIAPCAHCAPGTRGWNRPREFPEHWFTAAICTRGMARSSVSDTDNGRTTWPCTLIRKVVASTEVGISAQCQRTKNWSLGVKTLWSNTDIGVSSSGGRLRCRIIDPLPGKLEVSGRDEGPPGRARSTACCPQAGADQAAAATPPPITKRRPTA